MLAEKPWRAEAVMMFIGGLFASVFSGLALAGVLNKLGVPGFKESDDIGALLLVTLSFQGLGWVFLFPFVRWHGLDWRAALGLRGPHVPRAVLMGVTLGFLILPCTLLLQAAMADLMTRLGWPPEAQNAVTMLTDAKGWGTRIYLCFFAVVLAPVAEEFIFRGMLFPFLLRIGWPRTAWLGVSAAFALIHGNAVIFVPLFFLALALTWLYEKTDNLLAPIAAHATFNAVNLVLLTLMNEFARTLPPQP